MRRLHATKIALWDINKDYQLTSRGMFFKKITFLRNFYVSSEYHPRNSKSSSFPLHYFIWQLPVAGKSCLHFTWGQN